MVQFDEYVQRGGQSMENHQLEKSKKNGEFSPCSRHCICLFNLYIMLIYLRNHLGIVHSRKTARGQCFHDGLTKRSLDNSLFSILLMEEILHQLLIVYPTIYMVLGIPDGAGFLPSPVLISF